MNDRYDSFDDLLDDVLRLNRQGDRPDIASLCQRYPSFADDIRELLPSVLMMEDVKPNSDLAADDGNYEPDEIPGYRILSEIGRGGWELSTKRNMQRSVDASR